MKKSLKICTSAMVVLAGVFAASSCGSQSQDSPKSLVLYYSQTGVTFAVADELSQQLGADVARIEAVVPYDGDFQETIERCQKEREEGFVPEIEPLDVNMDDYDVIFLGYPIWFGTYAPPIAGLLEAYDLSGKCIVPFCTFGSGGLESSVADLKNAVPDAEIADGYGVRASRLSAVPAEVECFLKVLGFVEGEVEEIAEYSEQQPVTDEEKALFDAACGDYQFPLGTPETVGKRTTPYGTDYKFVVNGQTPDGEEAVSTIYVTVPAAEDAVPEFIRVVR